MSKIQAVLDEFMPCGGTVCPGCEVACKYVDGRTPVVDRMADAIIDLRAERDALRKGLLDLLAVVHRDGGHHTEAVGTRQSVVDAELAVHALRKDAARLDYLDTVRDPYSRRPMREVIGTEWSIVFTHPATHTPTIREALDGALAVQPTTGEEA